MALATENLYRASNELSIVRSTDSEMPTMRGHFAVWNQWTTIRSISENNGRPFLERFAPTSMNKTLAEGLGRMKVMFNHGQDPNVGQKLLGVPTRLEPDGNGADFEVPLFDTSYNRDLIPGLDAGVYGSSMRFTVERQDYVEKPKRSEYNPDGIPERTVTEARVFEFGPVSWPAYANATAGLRSLTDDFLFGQLVDDPERLAKLLEAYMNRNVEPEPSEATTPTIEETPEPAVALATRKEPEPSAATTRAKRTYTPVGLYTSRKEKPRWLL